MIESKQWRHQQQKQLRSNVFVGPYMYIRGPIYVYWSTHLSSYIVLYSSLLFIVNEVFVQAFTLIHRPLISHSEVLNEWIKWSASHQWTWTNEVNHSNELKITSLIGIKVHSLFRSTFWEFDPWSHLKRTESMFWSHAGQKHHLLARRSRRPIRNFWPWGPKMGKKSWKKTIAVKVWTVFPDDFLKNPYKHCRKNPNRLKKFRTLFRHGYQIKGFCK